MRVNIGPYTNWFGPYQLAELLCFWVKEVPGEYGMKSKPDWVHNFGEWLAYGSVEPEPKVGEVSSWTRDHRESTLLNKFLTWVESKKKRKLEVRIDKWDTWNMDSTLAHIILPMLKQLKEIQHGCAMVDAEDVPENLRVTERQEWDAQMDLFDMPIESEVSLTEERWNYVMDEMIFAFECKLDDSWEDEFRSGEIDMQWKKLEGGMSQMIDGPNNTYKCDYDGMKVVENRIQNGFRLFGKYYQNLWD
jgi:hypothetical protein